MITRLLQAVIVLSLLAILLILANSAASSAHPAVFTDSLPHDTANAIAFDQPDIDRIFYANLTVPGKVDFYSFQAPKGFSFKSKILIPRTDNNTKFRPALALFGPGLPKPDPTELYSVPFNLPADNGLITSIADKTQEDKTDDTIYSHYDEPYTQSSFWEGQTLLREIPQAGTYYLAVFSPNNLSGKYALEVGDRDATGLKETVGFPLLWFKVKLWFGDELAPAMLVLVLILLVVAVAVGRAALTRQKKKLRLSKPNRLRATVENELAPTKSVGTGKISEATQTIPVEEALSSELEQPTAPEVLAVGSSEQKPVGAEQMRIGEDKTYSRWRKGKARANLETDFLPEAPNEKTKFDQNTK